MPIGQRFTLGRQELFGKYFSDVGWFGFFFKIKVISVQSLPSVTCDLSTILGLNLTGDLHTNWQPAFSALSLSVQSSSMAVVLQDSGAMQWAPVAPPLLCSLAGTWANVCTSGKVSLQKLLSPLEACGWSSVSHSSLWVISTECPYPQVPGAHIATSDVFQKSSSLHTFSLQISQRWKQRYNVLIAKILIKKF